MAIGHTKNTAEKNWTTTLERLTGTGNEINDSNGTLFTWKLKFAEYEITQGGLILNEAPLATKENKANKAGSLMNIWPVLVG